MQYIAMQHSQIHELPGDYLMENNHFDQFNMCGGAATDSVKELESINAKVIGQLTQKNVELFNTAIEINNKFVALLGNNKDLQSLMTEQVQLTSEYTGKVISAIQDAAQIVVESKDDYQAWFEGSVKSATDFGRSPAAAPKKKAA
jgi:glycine betaine/choline ABC-type transport system substrate-binding protein